MFPQATHQFSPDMGWMELWCNRCGDHVPHDLVVTTDNQVTRTLAGTYRDQNHIVGIQAECNNGHRQTIL
jgi:hypothetical protein